MRDYSFSRENAHFWQISDQGVYEIARVQLPNSPPVCLKTIWQCILDDSEGSPLTRVLWRDVFTWHLRLDRGDIRGEGDFIGPATPAGQRQIFGNPFPAWQDRDYQSDQWTLDMSSYHIVLNGPGALRFFVTVRSDTVRDYWIAGRLQIAEWPLVDSRPYPVRAK